MKPTDFAPRCSAFLTYLKGNDLVGIEVGTDVGAHAHAMLQYCDIKKLYLVDIWDKEYYKGYCEGRLYSHGYKNKVELIHRESHVASKALNRKEDNVDFIYIDIPHDYETVRQSLEDWWVHLKAGGILGYRNYSPGNPGLKDAVDEFVICNKLRTEVISYQGEIIIYK
jgi:tRNA A58 N-methylase Trm61